MLNNLTVRTRLFSLIGMMSVLLAIIGFVGLQGMGQSNDGLRTVYLDRTIPLAQLAEMTDLMAENVRQLHLASMHDPRLPESKLHDHPIARHTDVVEKNLAEAGRIWKEYMATYLTPEEKVLAKTYDEISSEMVNKGILAVMPIFKQEKFFEGNEAMVKVVGPLMVKTMEAADALKGLQVDVAKEEFEKAETAYDRIHMIAIVSITLGIALAIFVGYVIVRNLMKQLGGEPDYAAGIVKRIATGDLSVSILTKSGDASSLLFDISTMVAKLSEIITSVRSGADSLASASEQISATAQSLSQASSEQAASVEET
ncbi:MAG: methyl-accepting chemotaxis protein, partial [Sideroxyarcus sp.]|nr:methyl-accepting chemotaxis protein [Sideroxyarcus sp.]